MDTKVSKSFGTIENRGYRVETIPLRKDPIFRKDRQIYYTLKYSLLLFLLMNGLLPLKSIFCWPFKTLFWFL